MFSIQQLFPFAQDFMPDPEYAWQLHPADLLGETVWCKLYDSDDDEYRCVVADWKERSGELYALFVPDNGRCERWRRWECAVEVA